MEMRIPRRKYQAFTLLEMLVVMVIFGLLIAIGFSAFSGLSDTITINQNILDLQQAVRQAQRAALFLERNHDERWVFGIGIDFSQVENDGKYRIFKWCSPFVDYGDITTRSSLPNYDPDSDLGSFNGNLGLASPYSYDACDIAMNLNEIVAAGSSIDFVFASNFIKNIPNDNNASGDTAGVPVYVLFEAVSGRAFFYDVNGILVNYSTDGQIVDSPIDFVFNVESEKTQVRKVLRISNISGKISFESQNL